MRSTGLSLLVAAGASLFGQSLTISQAVEGALRNYPAIRVSQEQISAAAAGIQLARTISGQPGAARPACWFPGSHSISVFAERT